MSRGARGAMRGGATRGGAAMTVTAMAAALAVAAGPAGRALADDAAARLPAPGAPAAALAEDAPPPLQTLIEPAAAELRLRRLPVQMKLRPAVASSVAAAPARRRSAAAGAPAPAAEAGAMAPAAEAGATATTWRGVRERVSFQVRAGVELDTAADSGEPLRGGARLGSGFTASRPWIVGDAIVGARDVLLPSLGAYLLGSFQLDASDSLASSTATVAPVDAADLPIAIKAGYAEYGRDDVYRDRRLWLRAGRQLRQDGGALFAYFDGATAGYRGGAYDVSAFAGRRVALYVDTEHGVLYGATAAADLGKAARVPVKLAADVMGLSLGGGARLLGVLRGTYAPARRASVDLRARLVDSGDGLALCRVGGRVQASAGRFLLVGDVEARRGGDLAYDLASPAAVDVVQVAQALGVGLSAPIDALTLGARADWRSARGDLEVLAFGRAERPQGTVVAVDQRGWYEGGAAVAGAPLGARGAGVWVTLQYKLRAYDEPGGGDGAGSAFGDTSTSGLTRMQELAADGTIAGRASSGGGRRWRLGLGGFYRVYDFRSPYVEVTGEGRGGGRGELSLWLSRELRAELAAELAAPSPVLARELGLMSSVRGAVEARW